MNVMEIKRNTNGDTRVADHMPTFTEFDSSNFEHRDSVRTMMNICANEINERGSNHDWTKTKEPYRSLFYQNFYGAFSGYCDFENGEWHKTHCKLERHHLLSCCPSDVNLFDVIEMVCDCVCAGMARTGSVKELEINSEILDKAVKNTTVLLANNVKIIDN